MMKHHRIHAFTLTELLLVLAIIGILVLLALPNLMPLISKAKGTEAQLQLKHLGSLQRSYFFAHSKYSDDISQLGFEQVQLVTEGGSANYQVKLVSASISSFVGTATAVVDFDSDGIFNQWQINEKGSLEEVIPD